MARNTSRIRDEFRGTLRLAPATRPIWLLAALGLCALPVPGSPLAAQDKSAADELPPPRTHYLGREIATTMSYRGADWLIRAERAKEEGTQELLKALNIKPGQVVCDMGCGNGYYTLAMAGMAGKAGRVLAVDIQPEMLTLLKARAKAEGVDNIQPVLGTVADPRLPEREIDLVLLVDVYHEFSYPQRMLRAIRRSLKPRGRIALVEFRGEDPSVPIKRLHKMTKAQIMKEVPHNGFRLVEEYDELPWQHVMFFEPAALPPVKD